MTTVPPDAWLERVRQMKAAGFSFFDWLGCVDEIGRSETFRIVLVLRNLSLPGANSVTLTTEVTRANPLLDSVSEVFAGANWHEREAAELFGVEFVGGQRRRLLLDPNFEGMPLRKDEVLAARTGVSWPGAKEPGESDSSPSRRRMVPPGVPDPVIWGDRDPEALAADPAEVADAAAGGRVLRPIRGRAVHRQEGG
jgi:NADH-quinone oxidoreductase subunit C